MSRDNSNKKDEARTPWSNEKANGPEGPTRVQSGFAFMAGHCLSGDLEDHAPPEEEPASSPDSTGCELRVQFPVDGSEPEVTSHGCSCAELEAASEAILDSKLCDGEDEEGAD